jgi:hypothetical protein
MSLKKIAQNVAQHIFVNIYAYLLPWKNWPKDLGYFSVIFKKPPQVNNRPIG